MSNTHNGLGGVVLIRDVSTQIVLNGGTFDNAVLDFNLDPVKFGNVDWFSYVPNDNKITTYAGESIVRVDASIMLNSTDGATSFCERYNGALYPLINGARISFGGNDLRFGNCYLRSVGALGNEFWVGGSLIIPQTVAASTELSLEIQQMHGTTAGVDEVRMEIGSTCTWERIG